MHCLLLLTAAAVTSQNTAVTRLGSLCDAALRGRVAGAHRAGVCLTHIERHDDAQGSSPPGRV